MSANRSRTKRCSTSEPITWFGHSRALGYRNLGDHLARVLTKDSNWDAGKPTDAGRACEVQRARTFQLDRAMGAGFAPIPWKAGIRPVTSARLLSLILGDAARQRCDRGSDCISGFEEPSCWTVSAAEVRRRLELFPQMILGRARLQPCRYRPVNMRALAPEGFIAYEHDAFMRWLLD